MKLFGHSTDSHGLPTLDRMTVPTNVAAALADWPAEIGSVPADRLLVEPLAESPAFSCKGEIGDNCWVVRDASVTPRPRQAMKLAAARRIDDVVIVALRLGQPVGIRLKDAGARLWLGPGRLLGAHLSLSGAATVVIGEDATAQDVRVMADDSEVRIGRDAMLSGQIVLNSAEHHAVIDLAGDAPALRPTGRARIAVGAHVWLGMRTLIVGSVEVGAGSIIGAGAVVTRDVPANVVAAGNPVEVKRENVTWSRKRDAVDAGSAAYIETLLAKPDTVVPVEPQLREELS